MLIRLEFPFLVDHSQIFQAVSGILLHIHISPRTVPVFTTITKITQAVVTWLYTVCLNRNLRPNNKCDLLECHLKLFIGFCYGTHESKALCILQHNTRVGTNGYQCSR